MSREEIEQLEQQLSEIRDKLTEKRKGLMREPIADYRLQTADGEVTLRELFGDKRDLIVIHNMGRSCPYCTLWADGFNGVAHHIQDRAAFVVASPDDPRTQQEFARARGWKFRMVSTRGSSFSRDLGYEKSNGDQWPGVSALHLNDDGDIVRTGRADFEPNDLFCSVWHLFGLLADGAAGWSPKYDYNPKNATGCTTGSCGCHEPPAKPDPAR